MIIGIGNDIIDIRRVERTLERFGDRFVNRVFTDVERAKSERRRLKAASYAKAVRGQGGLFQGLGDRPPQGRSSGRDMGVVNLPGGKPTIELTGGATAHLAAMLPLGMTATIHLTITDDFPQAQAFVIIEARADADCAEGNAV